MFVRMHPQLATVPFRSNLYKSQCRKIAVRKLGGKFEYLNNSLKSWWEFMQKGHSGLGNAVLVMIRTIIDLVLPLSKIYQLWFFSLLRFFTHSGRLRHKYGAAIGQGYQLPDGDQLPGGSDQLVDLTSLGILNPRPGFCVHLASAFLRPPFLHRKTVGCFW